MEASQVLEKHEDEFFEVVDAKVKLRWLRRKKVVPDSLVADIESSHGEKAKELLFEHLHLNANAVTLREYCNMLSGADAYPKMQKLGQKMLHDLPPEVQRRAIVTVLDAHRQDLEVTSLTSDLKDTGVLTAEQCQKLASLDDKERRHEALLYTLLASERPDTFHKLVGCMDLRDASTAARLQATFKGLVASPGALSVISSSSKCSPESPEERAGRQVVETMGGEVPPQQTEQAEPSRGGVQSHLEEERFAGEPRQEDGVSHPQQEEGASGKGALELELAEAREAKERLEGEVRRLQEELERNVTEQAVAKVRLEEDVRQLQAELARKSVQVDELQEQHKELERRYRHTEDEFEHFKAEHADCDVSKKKRKAQRRTERVTRAERPPWWRRLLGMSSTTRRAPLESGLGRPLPPLADLPPGPDPTLTSHYTSTPTLPLESGLGRPLPPLADLPPGWSADPTLTSHYTSTPTLEGSL